MVKLKKYPVYSTDEMIEVERMTSKKQHLDQDALIKRAGNALYQAIKAHHLIEQHQKIMVIYGKGNNGKDALWVGKLLQNDGFDVYFAKHDDDQSETISSYDAIIDGIYGAGFKGPLNHHDQVQIENMNRHGTYIISIDLPSGINANNGCVDEVAVRADVTLICHAYKRGNLLADAKDHHGQRILVDMGFEELHNHQDWLLTYDEKDVRLDKRKHHTHKYDYGHVLIVGGSKGMLGAPVLSAHAAFRSGAGLVSWACPNIYQSIDTGMLPEVMKLFYQEDQALLESLTKKNAIVFGPGMGKTATLDQKTVIMMIASKIPMVIDADGLAYLKAFTDQQMDLSHCVLTPHIEELRRLIDVPISDVKANPVGVLRSLSAAFGVVLLKGPCTLIRKGNTLFYLPWGNPGMAKAGFGDVLSGIIGAMLCTHEIEEAVFKAMMVFDAAGNCALNAYGEHAMMPSDLINLIKDVI